MGLQSLTAFCPIIGNVLVFIELSELYLTATMLMVLPVSCSIILLQQQNIFFW